MISRQQIACLAWLSSFDFIPKKIKTSICFSLKHYFPYYLEVETIEAVALFDYTGRTDKELSFKKNQLIYIYKKMNQEWWQGYLAGGSESGYVPDGYIKLRTRYQILTNKKEHFRTSFSLFLDVVIQHPWKIFLH